MLLNSDAITDRTIAISIIAAPQIPIDLMSIFLGLLDVGSVVAVASSIDGDADGEAVSFDKKTICGVGLMLLIGFVLALMVAFGVAVHPQVELFGQSGLRQNPE